MRATVVITKSRGPQRKGASGQQSTARPLAFCATAEPGPNENASAAGTF
jgi:hypothetical protein